MRALLIVIGVLAGLPSERVANACCAGCPCTKYSQNAVEQAAAGYTHSVRGSIPRWSLAGIQRFLLSGSWDPFPTKSTPQPVLAASGIGDPIVLPPSIIQFTTADQISSVAASPQKRKGQPRAVLVRRIEKHGSAILVEVDDRTWKLAACPKKPGYACLVDPGKLALDPIPAVPIPAVSP